MAGKGGYRPNSGRPKKVDEERIRDIVSPYRGEVIETVINIMKNAEKDADRLAAAKLMLAYDFGQPSQHINMDAKIEQAPFTPLNLDVAEDNSTS